MASWTSDQLAALEAAIATGTTRVSYGDKDVTYRSLDEMLQLRDTMRRAIDGAVQAPRRFFGTYRSGL